MGWMAPLRHRRAKLVFLENHQEREPSMSEITTIGLVLAKHVFQVHGVDEEGTTVLRKRLRRGQVLAFFSRIPRCVVGLEARATAHYWAREPVSLRPPFELPAKAPSARSISSAFRTSSGRNSTPNARLAADRSSGTSRSG
jgi:hypothetical protein